jgi:hypothetical protein
VEPNAVLLVDRADEAADLTPHDSLHWNGLGRDDTHLELSRAQRGRDFEPYKTRADDDNALRRLRLPDDGTAIGERAQIVDVRQLATGHIEPHRLGAGGDEERVVGLATTVLELDLVSRRVDCRGARAETQLDAVLPVEFRRAQRDPLFGRVAGEIVLRQIRPVVGRRGIAAQHRDAAGIALAAQRLGGAAAGRASAEDDY